MQGHRTLASTQAYIAQLSFFAELSEPLNAQYSPTRFVEWALCQRRFLQIKTLRIQVTMQLNQRAKLNTRKRKLGKPKEWRSCRDMLMTMDRKPGL